MVRTGSAAARPAAPAAKSRSRTPPPPITHPILFNTPEADRILEGLQVFPPDDPWNQDISRWPVHPNSRNIIASIGADKPLRYNPDMNFVLVPPDQKRVDVKITGYADESDPGPFPVPDNLPIEGWPAADRGDQNARGATLDEVQRDIHQQGGDRHAIVVDPTAGRSTSSTRPARPTPAGRPLRPRSSTSRRTGSAPMAGPRPTPRACRSSRRSSAMTSLLAASIGHALRVTVVKSRRAYVYPARHFASRNTNPEPAPHGRAHPPPQRLRHLGLLATTCRTILTALKHHGMFVADNGIDWAISVAPDERIGNLHEELQASEGLRRSRLCTIRDEDRGNGPERSGRRSSVVARFSQGDPASKIDA